MRAGQVGVAVDQASDIVQQVSERLGVDVGHPGREPHRVRLGRGLTAHQAGGGAQLLGGAHDSPPVCASAAACSAASARGATRSPPTTSASCRWLRRLSASTAARSCARRYSLDVGTQGSSRWATVLRTIASSHFTHGEEGPLAPLASLFTCSMYCRLMTTTLLVEPSLNTAYAYAPLIWPRSANQSTLCTGRSISPGS